MLGHRQVPGFFGLVSSVFAAIFVSSALAFFILIIPLCLFVEFHVSPVSTIIIFRSLSGFLLYEKLIYSPNIVAVFTSMIMNSTLFSSLVSAASSGRGMGPGEAKQRRRCSRKQEPRHW